MNLDRASTAGVNLIREISLDAWPEGAVPVCEASLQEDLERGEVLYFPCLAFEFDAHERQFLSGRWSDEKAKNISLRPASNGVRGARGSAEELSALHALLVRYAKKSERLVTALFPGYVSYMKRGNTSFRPRAITQNTASWRKDDTRLHVDAFPSNPVQGLRLLRVFTNVNAEGVARVWRVGEPFADFAARFLPRARRLLPGAAWLMHQLGITKRRRTPYDQLMLQLHDCVKADLEYQRTAPQQRFAFPPGCTWVTFSDQVLHAAMSGQYLLEQTFYLDPQGQGDPRTSPLKILEALTGRKLV